MNAINKVQPELPAEHIDPIPYMLPLAWNGCYASDDMSLRLGPKTNRIADRTLPYIVGWVSLDRKARNGTWCAEGNAISNHKSSGHRTRADAQEALLAAVMKLDLRHPNVPLAADVEQLRVLIDDFLVGSRPHVLAATDALSAAVKKARDTAVELDAIRSLAGIDVCARAAVAQYLRSTGRGMEADEVANAEI